MSFISFRVHLYIPTGMQNNFIYIFKFIHIFKFIYIINLLLQVLDLKLNYTAEGRLTGVLMVAVMKANYVVKTRYLYLIISLGIGCDCQYVHHFQPYQTI